MKKLLLILLCLPMIGFGQSWEQTYSYSPTQSSNNAWSVQQTTDGGYIVCGTSNSNPNGVYLLKIDGNGIEQWSQKFGGLGFAEGFSVQQTTDGGYIITGSTESFGNLVKDVYLLKTDLNGIEQWSKTFGGIDYDEGFSVQQTTDGGYIITGTTASVVNETTSVYLIKTDGSGTEQWSNLFTDAIEGFSVQQTTDGGYVIAAGDLLIKTDGNGQEHWNSLVSARDVQQTTDGGYIIVGGTLAANSYPDVSLKKTDSNGIEQWTKTFGGAGADGGYSVQQTNDGGYIIAGAYDSDWYAPLFGNEKYYLIKTDVNGDSLWTKTFGASFDFAVCRSVQQTTDGGYVICGWAGWNGVGGFYYVVKTDGQGSVTSTFNIPINPNRKLQKTVDILGKETKPQTNIPFIEIYDDGTVEKRIVIE